MAFLGTTKAIAKQLWKNRKFATSTKEMKYEDVWQHQYLWQ